MRAVLRRQVVRRRTLFWTGWLCSALALLVGCQRSLTPETAKLALAGEYRLVIKLNQVTAGDGSERSKHLVSEELLLRDDGTFDQTCRFVSGEAFRAERVAWHYDGGVHFSRLKDCSGFLGQRGGEIAASLVLRMGGTVRILLNPDLSVYYEQQTNSPTK